MDYRSQLNDKQFEAVSTSSLYARVIAGAGSGKTRVLTYRIAYLITECGIDPMRILAIAFTNKVAQEMKERANVLVKNALGHSPNLHISTFHSFCARFLRAECSHIGYPAGFSIYDEEDQTKMVKNVAVDLGYKKGDPLVKSALSFIRKNKGRGRYPENINPDNLLSEEERICWKFYSHYEEEKTRGYGLDFDDLLLKTIEILEEHPNVRERWADRFDCILVDEFQDTNDIQFKLIRLLMKQATSVYVVGDPDQTIYTWRGANPNIILDYDRVFPGAETIILNENYRSTQVILNAANKLISHNKKRVPKDLFTNAASGSPIQTKIAGSIEFEAEWVTSKIAAIARKHIVNGEPDYRDIAILYRSSYLTRSFEAALKDRGIPYRIFGGLRFYERMEVKDVLAYFNLLVNDFDNVSFERIVNVPKRGIGDATLLKIRHESAQAGLSEYQYFKNIAEYGDTTEISAKAIHVLKQMIDLMENTKTKLTERLEAYSGILRDMIVDLGYLTYLANEEDPDEDRIKNVNALFDDITHFLSNNPDSSFSEYLQNVALLTAQDDMSSGNYVSLMTIHVAKGLEFDYVFVIGMNDGTFPSQRAVNEIERDGEEEERRLAYVAFTRARKELYLSGNRSYSYVTDSQTKPSQYFAEAGIQLPKENDFTSNRVWNNTHRPRPVNNRWDDFFSDGDAISPFETQEKKKETPPPAKKNNVVWHVGDRLHHEKFGDGIVTLIISDTIIAAKFDEGGTKTLLSNHPMLSKISSSGGEA